MSMADHLKSKGTKHPAKPTRKPGSQQPPALWRGPEQDGVTYSLLSRFLVCRERFRLLVVHGLKPAPQFSHRLHYGQMWHVCEELHAQGMAWEGALDTYCQQLTQEFPTAVEQVRHWARVCAAQFPVYLDYWKDTGGGPPGTGLTGAGTSRPILAECVFGVPYKLPSGRVIILRGCWDGVLAEGRGRNSGLYIHENKTKGDVNPEQIQRQLGFDLQTMIYVVALEQVLAQDPELPSAAGEMSALWRWCNRTRAQEMGVAGVRYNVVRRPLSGGKGSIVRHKPSKGNPLGETEEDYYARLQDVIRENADTFFLRWAVHLTQQDILRFRRQCLDPILEQLCDWWQWITQPGNDILNCIGPHWRHPFGVYNVLDEGGSSELDEYLESGSEAGLQRAATLFPELERGSRPAPAT